MAFLMDKKQDTGVVVQYWSIEKVHVDVKQGYVDVSFQGYLNANEFAAGSQPIISTNVRFDQDLGVKAMTDFLSLCQNLLVSTGDYAGAQIVG